MSYCERFPEKIRYLNSDEGRSNRGMSASRNLGLRAARGAFAAFLDGDDCWYPTSWSDRSRCSISIQRRSWYAGRRFTGTAGRRSPDRDDKIMQVGQWDKIDAETAFALDQDRLYAGAICCGASIPLGKGVSPSMSGNMFRRDVVMALGGFDDCFAVCSRIRLSGPRSI